MCALVCGELQAESASLYAGLKDHTISVSHSVRSWGREVVREKPFNVIHEFDSWRKSPDLAEAVAAIKALTAVIKRSEATTMMGLEVELKNASDTLKVGPSHQYVLCNCTTRLLYGACFLMHFFFHL